MPSKHTHDAVATVGEYTDRQTGEKKKCYLTVGKVFTHDDGRMSMKLEAVPVGPEWSGWISLYPARDKDQQRPATGHQRPPEMRSHDRAKADAFQPQPDDGGEIPF